MYDPSIGRWLEEDPIGFKAGDENLYRYVGNAPLTEVDPSGLVGIMFDGAGFIGNDGSIIANMGFPHIVGEIKDNPDRNAWYIKTNIGDLKKQVDTAEKYVLDALAKHPDEPVDIFGWSRGGIAAVALCQRLAKRNPPINIRFLALIDPTAPVKRITEDSEFLDPDFRKIPDNVQNAALFVRDGKHDGNWANHEFYKILFDYGNFTFAKNTKLVEQSFPLDHLQMGFSRDVGKKLWEAATNAKVPLGGGNIFERKEYNETPRGGMSDAKILEKLCREALKP